MGGTRREILNKDVISWSDEVKQIKNNGCKLICIAKYEKLAQTVGNKDSDELDTV